MAGTRRVLIPVAMATVLTRLWSPTAAFAPCPAALRLHPFPMPVARGLSLAASRVPVSVRRAPAPMLGLRMAATASAPSKIAGPEWSNADEYASLDAPELKADLECVTKLVDQLKVLSGKSDLEKLDALDTTVLVEMTRKSTDAAVLLMNVATFASCESSVDGSNLDARSLTAKVRAISSKMTQATQSASLAIKLAPDAKIAEFLSECPEEKFNVEHRRKMRDFTLTLAEENLITALSVDGNSAWSQLYNSISRYALPIGLRTVLLCVSVITVMRNKN